MLEIKINLLVNFENSGAVPLIAEGVDCRGCKGGVDELLELPEGADVKLVHTGCLVENFCQFWWSLDIMETRSGCCYLMT